MGNLKQYFSNLEAEQYCTELFNREEALATREQLKNFFESLSKEKSENKELSKNLSVKLEVLVKDIESMKKSIEKDIGEIYDGKLHEWVEKIKKQNQELWEESLKHIKTEFKEIGNFYMNF